MEAFFFVKLNFDMKHGHSHKQCRTEAQQRTDQHIFG